MRAVALTPEQGLARAMSYRGTRGTGRAVVEFTRQAVADALGAAPTPLTSCWVSYSTSVVGRLAKECDEQGLPMDRSVVLDRARIDRFLSHGCRGLGTATRASYRSRLDIVAAALLGGQNDGAWPRAVIPAGDPLRPWDDAQAARVALWTSGARPESRRTRLQAALALSLGAGLRRRDLVLVRSGHVARHDDGTVQVTVVADGADPGRTVVITAAWERQVLDAADRAGGNLLVAPDRTALTAHAFSNTIEKANRAAPAGDEFSVRRARSTWLVRHMAAGTPLPLLMEQAGLRTVEHLSDLLPYVPAVDPAAAAAFMRGV